MSSRFLSSLNRIIRQLFKAGGYALSASVMLSLLLNGGCGEAAISSFPAKDTSKPGGVEVMIQSGSFSPQEIRIKPGETVTWINEGEVSHTVTSWRQYTADDGWKYVEIGTIWDSGDVKPGESYTRSFNQEGTYQYASFPMYLYTVFQLQSVGTVIVSNENN
ncbi:MAG: plastocyanin/azurin family copper-binding protein [Dehalococcoidales bacterium]|jgi:plastocyanin|nr:plastocyanin/azurin family copper-binding protein [Dehalococcoidales bacterium]